MGILLSIDPVAQKIDIRIVLRNYQSQIGGQLLTLRLCERTTSNPGNRANALT